VTRVNARPSRRRSVEKDPENQLPQPDHPFSKWIGGVCAALWAVGVQSLPSPWNALLAILTPGVGYLAGHALDLGLRRHEEGESERKRTREWKRSLDQIKISISIIEKELVRVKAANCDRPVIDMYQEAYDNAQAKLAEKLKELP